MKSTLLRASMLLGASLFAVPALAQDTDAFYVKTTVAPFCSQIAANSDPMNLGSLTGATGQLVAEFAAGDTSRELSSSFYCNAPSRVTIVAEPLETVNSTTDTSSFTSRVDYTAALAWSNVQGQVSSTDTDGTLIEAAQANIGTLTLTLSNPTVANNLRPVAGDYSGLVTVSIALAQ